MGDRTESPERLLGKLIVQAEYLEQRLTKIEEDVKNRRDQQDKQWDDLKSKVGMVEGYWNSYTASRKAVLAVLTIGIALGGFLMKLFEFFSTK